MAMNFAQLRQAFETYTNTSGEVSDTQLAIWLNESLFDIAYDLGTVSCLPLQVEAGDELPSGGWLRLLCCDLEHEELPDGTLRFCEGGSGKLYYRAQPQLFSGSDSAQVCDLHPALHYLPALFAAARYWDCECDGDSGESALAAKWLSFYYQGKNLARARLSVASGGVEGWSVR